MFVRVLGVFFLFFSFAWAQDLGVSQRGFLRDSVDVLDDISVQYEANIAMDSMYNFNFRASGKRFRWLSRSHSWHPLPYFLLGLNAWWKIMPNTYLQRYDEEFLRYMDTAQHKAKVLYRMEGSEGEGAFFLATIHAFLARFHSERSHWNKAISHTRRALRYLKRTREEGYMDVETLVGEGLYNYYVEWVREHYPSFRPVLWFFRRGDKALGLIQLRKAAHYSMYSRVEAQTFLMKILLEEGKDIEDAERMAKYLHNFYPNNPFFSSFLCAYFVSKACIWSLCGGM